MTASQSAATPSVSHDAVREALAKLISSEAFRGSERSRTLLRFVVERTLKGQTEGLKEYTLGTEALGRSSAFDPRTDTVVRSEVSRLRTRLDKYYATEGQSDEVVISLSKGSYVPRFERRPALTVHPAGGTPERPLSVFRRRGPLAVAAAALVAAIALIAYREIVPLNNSSDAKAGLTAATVTAELPVSIVVLPFLNLSGDAGQDYFSDGITEEITSALARVPGLTVLARTSAFQYKGQNRDVRSIGDALGARYLIEGSVRKDGERVRISAQLVQAADGAHVWAETYDRRFTDVFKTQEDIAQAIASSLRLPLGVQDENLVSNRASDQLTYELYLRGRAAFRARDSESLVLLEQLVTRDPNFAPGWAWLGRASVRFGNDQERAETAARRAIALDPAYAGGYALLASLSSYSGKLQEATDLYKQALARDPYDPEVLNIYGNDLRGLGYLKEANDVFERLHLVEPLVPIYNRLRAEVLAANGKTETALFEYLRSGGKAPNEGLQFLAPAYAELGKFADAIDAMSKDRPQSLPQTHMEAAALVLRAAADKSAAPAQLPDLDWPLNFAYAYTATPERMLDSPAKAANERTGAASQFILRSIWWPMPASLRKTERFKAIVRDAGFVDHWRDRGWPDLCRPVGVDDFECD